MPTYDYKCLKCGDHIVHIASISEPPLLQNQQCKNLGSPCQLQKIMSSFAMAKSPEVRHELTPTPVPTPTAAETAKHLCSKYCDLHK